MLNKKRENIRGKNLGVTHENEPKQKQRPNKQVTFVHALQRMDYRKFLETEWCLKKKGTCLA
jgi:hypothetical protein